LLISPDLSFQEGGKRVNLLSTMKEVRLVVRGLSGSTAIWFLMTTPRGFMLS